ncbi:MAG: hypothetical protein HPM95_06495 [Alphaproteobacteria bacterium]|nr:hypothetical protein [Alphaproteobacteria bacterium]
MQATGTKYEYYITVLAEARKFSKISELASLQLSERVYNGGTTGPLDGVHRNYDGFPGNDVSGQAFNFWGRPIYKTIAEVLTEEKCFSSSTKICLLDDSNVRIKDIRVGDIVLSFDPLLTTVAAASSRNASRASSQTLPRSGCG